MYSMKFIIGRDKQHNTDKHYYNVTSVLNVITEGVTLLCNVKTVFFMCKYTSLRNSRFFPESVKSTGVKTHKGKCSEFWAVFAYFSTGKSIQIRGICIDANFDVWLIVSFTWFLECKRNDWFWQNMNSNLQKWMHNK